MAFSLTTARVFAKSAFRNGAGKWAVFALIAVFFPSATTHSQSAGVPYQATIQGTEAIPSKVIEIMEAVSQTFQKKADPPQSMALLERRAEEDLPEIKKVLRSFGFFKNNISLQLRPPKEGKAPSPHLQTNPEEVEAIPESARTVPATVVFQVNAGPRFSFGEISITLTKETAEKAPAPPTAAEAGIEKDAPYTAAKVVEAGNFLLTHYQNNGYPFPKIADREVVADFSTHTVSVRFEVNPVSKAVFGETLVDGLTTLEPLYVYELIPWKKGEGYDRRLIEKARRVLFDTNLFSIIEFNDPGSVDDHGQLPITVRVRERSPRTIRLGVEYTTDYGPGVNGSWTHRNLFGMGEKFTAGTIFNSKIRTAFLRFDKPMFLEKDNTFIAESAFNDETTDAYDARSLEASTILNRKFTEHFQAGGGVGFRYGRVKQKTDEAHTEYHLAFLPLTASQDTRKNLLNPTHGYNLTLSAAPYQDVVDGNLRFFRYRLSGSTYYNFNTGDKVVAAVRADFGQMIGVDHAEMPADLRFYAGGGGSVRGFAYQYAGPVKGNTPLGGLSTLTFSLELRFKITESIGLVPFLDGGTVYLDTVPDFGSQKLYYGTGLGLRYYTAIGPIRLDVAMPINWREGVDSRYQIYVSIGQAF